jgi:hypothetical protein
VLVAVPGTAPVCYARSMFDWIGSLRIREKSRGRVVLSLSRSTQLAGTLMLVAGLAMSLYAWPISPWLAAAPVVLAVLGGLLVTLRRELTVDREAGVLRVEQRAFGVHNQQVVPLFHLRAVVVEARPGAPMTGNGRYVAYLDRRVGQAIYLDEARRCAVLLRLAEAIADVAELRLEYDAQGGAEA